MPFNKHISPWTKHYLPLLLLIGSLVLLSLCTIRFFQTNGGREVVKAIPLHKLVSVDRVPVVRLNGTTLSVLGVQRGIRGKAPFVWVKNMNNHRVAKIKVGQNIFGTNVYLSGIGPSRLELRSKSGIHQILLRK